jgi:acetylornithine aminotransferase
MEHILRCHELVENDIVRGENCYLYDKDGKRYVDFESGIWCTVVGHRNLRINEKIKEQLDKVIHLGYRFTNHLAEEAAKILLDTVSERKGKCVFLSSGTEAVEFGINAAKLLTGRNNLLTFSESYLGAYGSAGMRDDSWIKVDFNSKTLENFRLSEVAAFILEPGSSSGKVKFPPEEIVQRISKEIKNSGGLIVVDEVTTGVGRTGEWYGFNHYTLKPDLVAIGKGLGNGYPVSAVAMKREIGKQLENRRFRYVQSHQNDPLGCAIANEVISMIKEKNLVNRSRESGKKFMNHLEKIKNSFQFVKEVRGRGLMIGMEFYKLPRNFSVEFIFNQMLKRGFIIGFHSEANLIRFMPALTIEEKEIEKMVDNLDEVLKKLN